MGVAAHQDPFLHLVVEERAPPLRVPEEGTQGRGQAPQPRVLPGHSAVLKKLGAEATGK